MGGVTIVVVSPDTVVVSSVVVVSDSLLHDTKPRLATAKTKKSFFIVVIFLKNEIFQGLYQKLKKVTPRFNIFFQVGQGYYF